MTPLQTTRSSRIARRAVFAAALATLLGLAGCGAQNAPCPTKGWVTDRCAPFGEFRYGDKLLRIPNTEPNKYRWEGGLTYDSEREELTSPNLAFYWRSGKAAGRASGDWPIWADDLVRFSMSYTPRDPLQLNALSRTWRPPFPSNAHVELPFALSPELLLHTERNKNSELKPKDRIIFLDTAKAVILRCPSLNDFSDKTTTGNLSCSGVYYPQAGLRLSLSIPVASLKDWPSVKTSIQNLIKSWEAPIADQPTTH
jgi:hypothetical protein